MDVKIFIPFANFIGIEGLWMYYFLLVYPLIFFTKVDKITGLSTLDAIPIYG